MLQVKRNSNEVVAISFAERLGRPDGYHLSLAAVKQSLPFSFLNGATSYAAFCADLLHEHYAGTFHQNMKMSLFTTPYRAGKVNVALDTQRGMDHKNAIKGFRPRSTIQPVIPRMTVVDRFNETHASRTAALRQTDAKKAESINSIKISDKHLVQLTAKDLKKILPVTKLISRADALNTTEDKIPRNMYTSKLQNVSKNVIDKNTYELGQFLIKKYAVGQGMFDLDKSDCPDLKAIVGPKELIRKSKNAKELANKENIRHNQ